MTIRPVIYRRTHEPLPNTKEGLVEEVRALREENDALWEGLSPARVKTFRVKGAKTLKAVKVVKIRGASMEGVLKVRSFSANQGEIFRIERVQANPAAFRTRLKLKAYRHGQVRVRVPMPAETAPAPLAAPALSGIAAAGARGQAAIAHWIKDGTLVPSKTISDAWGLTPQALGQAVEQGKLFSYKHGNKRFYPSSMIDLGRDDIAAVCQALGQCDDAQKLIFWTRAHGGLEGRTAPQALANGELARVVELAEAWAERRGLTHAPEAA